MVVVVVVVVVILMGWVVLGWAGLAGLEWAAPMYHAVFSLPLSLR